MRRVSDLLFDHARSMAGYFEARRVHDLDSLRQSEWSAEFEQLMRNRLIMGAFRYGTQEQQAKKRIDRLGSLKRRLANYEATGNLEHMVDFAAIAMAEFIHPGHYLAHFAAADDSEHADITDRGIQ